MQTEAGPISSGTIQGITEEYHLEDMQEDGNDVHMEVISTM
jgi:hypothetical protein